MSRILLIGALCGCVALSGHAQGLPTWLAQLAALRTLEQTVGQDYATMTNGLTHIGDIRYDEYQLHAAYYGSLATVNPAVTTDPTTTELLRVLQVLVTRLQQELAYWQAQPSIQQP